MIMVYDVEQKRVGKMLRTGRKYLHWVQNSVLEGELTPAGLEELKAAVRRVMDEDCDSVILYTWRSERYSARQILGMERGSTDQFI